MSDQSPSGPTDPAPGDQPAPAPQEDSAQPRQPDLLEAMLSGKLVEQEPKTPGLDDDVFAQRVAAAAAEVEVEPPQGDTPVEPAADLAVEVPADPSPEPPATETTEPAEPAVADETVTVEESPATVDAAGAEPAAQQKPVSPRQQKSPEKRPSGNRQRRQEPPVDVPPLIDGPMVVVRYGVMRAVGQFRHKLKGTPSCGAKVVVRTSRGTEMGVVVGCTGGNGGPDQGVDNRDVPDQGGSEGGSWAHRGWIDRERLGSYCAVQGAEYPIKEAGRILRPANTQDMIDAEKIESLARQESAFCRQTAAEMKLDMKVVAVDHLLGGDRLVFYFTSEHRVDFRKLVQSLSSQYHTRIEMRQVGARDEARLVADYEKCGQQCCCRRFLKELRPVSMRMAKMQKASLDPTKISGRCGRLMCCMRYEDETYQDLRKRLPKKKSHVRTESGVCKVLDTQIITQLVLLGMPDGTTQAIPNEEILERHVDPAAVPAPDPARVRRETPRRQATATAEPKPAPDVPKDPPPTDASGAAGDGASRPAKKKRRRKRGGKKSRKRKSGSN